MSKNPNLLAVVTKEIIIPGRMAADLVNDFAQKDTTGIRAWLQQMEIDFYNIIAKDSELKTNGYMSYETYAEMQKKGWWN